MRRLIRKWKCGKCGRSNRTGVALEETVKCAYCAETKVPSSKPSGDRDPGEDLEKRMSFARLRRQYARARKLVSSEEPYANLDWILGAQRDIVRSPLHLEEKMIGLAALWLEDLAAEVDREPAPPSAKGSRGGILAHGRRRSAAQALRDAVKRFLRAFEVSPANPARVPASRRVAGVPSR
jgi:hypothetical protein